MKDCIVSRQGQDPIEQALWIYSWRISTVHEHHRTESSKFLTLDRRIKDSPLGRMLNL